MKVLLAVPALRLGGVETYLLRLARHLAGRGHEVTVLETDGKGPWSDRFSREGMRVKTLSWGLFRSERRHLAAVREELSRHAVVVLNDAPRARAVAGELPEAVSVVAVVHTDLSSQYATALGGARDFDHVVGVSGTIVERLAASGLPGDLVSLIPCGVEAPGQWPKGAAPEAGKGTALFLGRLSDWHKGIFLLPGIAARVLETFPDFKLQVVGDGPDAGELRRRVRQLGVAKSVILAGAVAHEEVHGWLAGADILLLPSNFEGFPVAPLEAMAAGVVPVATRLAGATDTMIRDGETGFLVPRGDAEGFAARVRELLADPAALRRMSRRAWEEVRARHSLEAMGEAYEELFRVLAQRQRKTPRTGRPDPTLVGDYPRLPRVLVRPTRKLLRTLGLRAPAR